MKTKDKRIKILCSHCNSEFETVLRHYKHRLKNGQKKFFCSLDCYWKHPRPKQFYTLKCDWCNKEFTRSAKCHHHNINFFKRSSKFCSKGCASAHARTEDLNERFWRRVNKTPGLGPMGDCWEWTASKDRKGYGNFNCYLGTKAHRVSYILANGPILNKLVVMHYCDNKSCVNPSHLSLGTIKENNMDKVEKLRYLDKADLVRECEELVKQNHALRMIIKTIILNKLQT